MIKKRRVRLSKQEIKKKVFRKQLSRFTIEDLTGSPQDVSRHLMETAEQHSKYDTVRYESFTEYYEGNSRNEYLLLVGYKEETDTQYEARIDKLKEAKRKENEKAEKAERKVLKSLLKKYGNN